MDLVFLHEASLDIDRLYDFLIESDTSSSAQKAMLAIKEGINLLLENPDIGIAMADHPNHKQLFIPFGKSAYVLRYRIDTTRNTIVVIRLWHGKENR